MRTYATVRAKRMVPSNLEQNGSGYDAERDDDSCEDVRTASVRALVPERGP